LRLEFRVKSFLAFDPTAALNSLKFESGIPGVFAGNENGRYRKMSKWEGQSEFEPETAGDEGILAQS